MIDVHLITDSKPFWQDASWLAVATGILALIISGITTWLNLRHQKSNLLLQLRHNQLEDWVDKFRNDLTTFLASTDGANAIIQYKKFENPNITYYEIKPLIEDKITDAHVLRIKLETYLDLEVSNHQEMSALLDDYSINSSNWRKAVDVKPLTHHEHPKTAFTLRGKILRKTGEIITQKRKNILK